MARLTPSEVKAVRKRAGLSQAEFAKRLHVGIASVKRWELGTVVQNKSADEAIRAVDAALPVKRTPKFRTFDTPPPHLVRAAERFKLRV